MTPPSTTCDVCCGSAGEVVAPPTVPAGGALAVVVVDGSSLRLAPDGAVRVEAVPRCAS